MIVISSLPMTILSVIDSPMALFASGSNLASASINRGFPAQLILNSCSAYDLWVAHPHW